MSLCTSCNYPIPSWQHNGACKPVAEKVPWAARIANKAADIGEAMMRVTEIRTETPDPVRKPGRPKKWASEAERQAAYRARKQQ